MDDAGYAHGALDRLCRAAHALHDLGAAPRREVVEKQHHLYRLPLCIPRRARLCPRAAHRVEGDPCVRRCCAGQCSWHDTRFRRGQLFPLPSDGCAGRRGTVFRHPYHAPAQGAADGGAEARRGRSHLHGGYGENVPGAQGARRRSQRRERRHEPRRERAHEVRAIQDRAHHERQPRSQNAAHEHCELCRPAQKGADRKRGGERIYRGFRPPEPEAQKAHDRSRGREQGEQRRAAGESRKDRSRRTAAAERGGVHRKIRRGEHYAGAECAGGGNVRHGGRAASLARTG